MTRRLVVARALQPALAGDRALLLLGLAEGGSDFRVAGAIPAAGADIAAVEAMMPWPLGVVGWAQAASDEDPPATAEDLPVSCRGDEWQAGGEPATPDFSGCWHDGLGLVRARVAFSSDAATLADAVAQLGASLEHPKTVFVTRDGKGNVKTLGALLLAGTFFSPPPLPAWTFFSGLLPPHPNVLFSFLPRLPPPILRPRRSRTRSAMSHEIALLTPHLTSALQTPRPWAPPGRSRPWSFRTPASRGAASGVLRRWRQRRRRPQATPTSRCRSTSRPSRSCRQRRPRRRRSPRSTAR